MLKFHAAPFSDMFTPVVQSSWRLHVLGSSWGALEAQLAAALHEMFIGTVETMPWDDTSQVIAFRHMPEVSFFSLFCLLLQASCSCKLVAAAQHIVWCTSKQSIAALAGSPDDRRIVTTQTC